MNDLAVRLRALREDTKNEPDRFELAAYIERAVSIADVAEAWVEQTADQCVYWIESRAPGDDGPRSYQGVRVSVAASPVDVAPLLDKHLFSREHGVILTSATLATRTVRTDEPTEHAETAFAHTIGRLGCEGARTLQLGSPFEYARQVEVFVDRSMPSPSPAGARSRASGRGPTQSYEQALAERIAFHARATDGGAFVLFTSFATLNKVADLVRTELEAGGLTLLCQGRDGPRSEILRLFRETERSVLFGAASFWQGVDVRGRALRNVIITRLPYGDGEFDLVYTASVLVHVRPEDLAGILGELARVSRGHVLHIENRVGWSAPFTPDHNGCWTHDLPAAYRALGWGCEDLGAGDPTPALFRALAPDASPGYT
ncbi:MAG: methyltransferase domain-containing protein, partial [Phycisphaerales bacterium]|nr:methyltransferase domain-containing protein [Phycisphaerales bacterium]